MRRVAIYARVSTDEQAEEGHSIDAQVRLCRELAARKGWTVVAEYLDPGFSGTTTARPSFQQLLRDARLGKFDVIAVHKLDRFSRSLVDMLTTLSKLSEQGKCIIRRDVTREAWIHALNPNNWHEMK